jgi:hypothetical protein
MLQWHKRHRRRRSSAPEQGHASDIIFIGGKSMFVFAFVLFLMFVTALQLMRNYQLALLCCRTVAAAKYLAGAADTLAEMNRISSSSSDDSMFFNDELQQLTQVTKLKAMYELIQCILYNIQQNVLQSPLTGCFLTNRYRGAACPFSRADFSRADFSRADLAVTLAQSLATNNRHSRYYRRYHNRLLVVSDMQLTLNSANAVAHVPSAPSGIKDWNHRSVIIDDNTGTKALAYVLGRDKYIR